MKDFWEQSSFYFQSPEKYDEKAVAKFWKADTSEIISRCRKELESAVNFSSAALEEKMKDFITAHGLGFGAIMNPLRLAIVGEAKGPHLFDILEMIGKSETLNRIDQALARLSS